MPYCQQRFNEMSQAISQKILILDGAMGTMIQRHKLDEEDYRGQRFHQWSYDLKGNNDLLSITQPRLIYDIHQQYLQAGSDIITTNTFSSTHIAQNDYGLGDLAYELNFESAKLARQACDDWKEKSQKTTFVAGAIGPTNQTLSLSPDVNDPGFRTITFDELAHSYTTAAKGLIDGGVDLILIETVFDTLNAKAAIFALSHFFEEQKQSYPLMISGTITDASGRTLSGQTNEAFYNSIRHANPFSIGLNCALGAQQLRPYIDELSRKASDCHICAYPNAGLPNQFGEYDQTPEEMSCLIKEWGESGLLNIAGGCCGTTPDHILALSKALENIPPRPLKPCTIAMRLSGLEALDIMPPCVPGNETKS